MRWLLGWRYIIRYTLLTSPNKDEKAVHCCDPALSVLVMLVSRNVFHVVSVLQSIVSYYPTAPRRVHITPKKNTNIMRFFKIGSVQPNPETVTCGIPQGSTLGPLLYLISMTYLTAQKTILPYICRRYKS